MKKHYLDFEKPLKDFDDEIQNLVSIDSESEKLVQDALHNLMEHRTTFVIAHRLSTIKNAHSIIVLDKGKIIESGTHYQLLANCGLYKKYYEMQVINDNKNGER